MIEAQEATKALFTLDRSDSIVVGGWDDKEAAEALVRSLEVVVGDVLANSETQVSLADQDEPVEALGLDRQNESLGEGVRDLGCDQAIERV